MIPKKASEYKIDSLRCIKVIPGLEEILKVPKCRAIEQEGYQ